MIVESEDPPIYEYKHTVQNFNLIGYGTVNIFLNDFSDDIKAQNTIKIPKVPHQTNMIKKISLNLYLWYEKAQY